VLPCSMLLPPPVAVCPLHRASATYTVAVCPLHRASAPYTVTVPYTVAVPYTMAVCPTCVPPTPCICADQHSFGTVTLCFSSRTLNIFPRVLGCGVLNNCSAGQCISQEQMPKQIMFCPTAE